ncbi:MAG: hypothetical protein BAJALOKI3v1_590003 [Promethearchaeota archaeon]|nr:MAG: hypothetical protein BAJALOKI3v1_590003 [Candidatus Lokiarchaeota archaeon]
MLSLFSFHSDGIYELEVYLIDEFYPHSKLLLEENIKISSPPPHQ